MVAESNGGPSGDGFTHVDVGTREGVIEALAHEVEEFDKLRFASKTLSAALDNLRLHLRDDRPYPAEMLVTILKGIAMMGERTIQVGLEATGLITNLMCRMRLADTPTEPAD